MNKLQKLHFQKIDDSKHLYESEGGYQVSDTEAAINTAELTEDISIKFANWIAKNWTPSGREEEWDSNELNSNSEPKYLVDSTKNLFNLFLKTL